MEINIEQEIEKRKKEIAILENIQVCQANIIGHVSSFHMFNDQGLTDSASHHLKRIKINNAIIERLTKRLLK